MGMSIAHRFFPAAAGQVQPQEWSYRQTVTIAASNVDSDLTNFPVMLTEANFASGLWTNAKQDGSDIVITDTSGNRLDHELVEFDPVAETLLLFVRVPTVSSSSDTDIRVYYGNADVTIASKATTWNSDFEAVVHLQTPEIKDSSPNGNTITVETVTSAWKRPWWLRPTATSADVDCHQGVATDGTDFWTFDTNRIDKRNGSFTLQSQNTDPNGDATASTDHVGDGDVYDGTLYVPMEQYTSCGSFSNQIIAEFNASTLAYVTEHDVSAQGHEVSSLVVEPDDDRITVTSYCDGTKLWQYKLSDFSFLGTVTLSESIPNMQGITRIGGHYYISASASEDNIRKVRLDGTVIGIAYTVDPALIMEGLATDGTDVYCLTDDDAGTEVVTTLEVTDGAWFPSDSLVANEDAAYLLVELSQAVETVTYGAVFMPVDNQQRTILSISEKTDGSNRNTIAIDDGDNLGNYDFNGQGWMYSGVDPTLDAVQSVHVTINDGGNREIFHNGASENSAAAGAIPATRDHLYIGCEDDSTNETWRGEMRNVRLYTAVQSDDWIAFEDLNLRSPGSTYSVGAEQSGTYQV